MKTLIATFLGCALGLGLGWSFRSKGAEGRDALEFAPQEATRRAATTGITGIESRQSGGNAAGGGPQILAKHDLTSLLRHVKLHYTEGDPFVVREAERLDTESLHALVASMTADSLLRDTQDRFELSLSLKAIASVQFRREGVRALEWADKLPDPKVRELVLGETMRAALTQDPEAALPWFDRLNTELDSKARSEWASRAVMGATGRSVEDLFRLRELYGDRLSGVMWPTGPYAEDFDYQKFLSEAPEVMEYGKSEVMKQWALQDRAAAFKIMRETLAKNSEPYGMSRGYFSAVAAMEGHEKAASQVLGQLNEASPEERLRMIQSMAYQQYGDNESGAKIMEALPREEDQLAFARELLNTTSSDELSGKVLAGVRSEAKRIELMTELAQRRQVDPFRDPNLPPDEDFEKFEAIMKNAGMSDRERKQVSGNLRKDAEEKQKREGISR